MQPIGILFFLAVGGVLFDKLGPWGAFLVKGIANILLGIWIFIVRGAIKIQPEKV